MGFDKAMKTHAFVCQDPPNMPADMNIKPAFPHKGTCIHIHMHTYPPTVPPSTPNTHTHTTPQAPHTHWFSYGISWVALDR